MTADHAEPSPQRPRITDADALRNLIRSIAINDPDPTHVKNTILGMDLDYNELRIVADSGFREVIRHILIAPHLPPPPDKPTDPSPGGKSHEFFTPPNKWARLHRNAYLAQLNSVLIVAGEDGTNKYLRLGDCTVKEVRSGAELRRKAARASDAEADKLTCLADTMEQHGAQHVRVLPEEVGSKILHD